MSAAEKLRALEARMPPKVGMEDPMGMDLGQLWRLSVDELSALRDLRYALPQIVAVVEAADTAAASLHLESHVGDVFRLSGALRALDEALT